MHEVWWTQFPEGLQRFGARFDGRVELIFVDPACAAISKVVNIEFDVSVSDRVSRCKRDVESLQRTGASGPCAFSRETRRRVKFGEVEAYSGTAGAVTMA